jgi:cyclophilin family peptidyl-prolyl cis-trans isomerase
MIWFVALGCILAGCSQSEPSNDSAQAAAGQLEVGSAMGSAQSVSADNRLQQPFAEATFAEPPPEWQRPPDTTLAGKSVGKLYVDVVNLWDTIRFVTPSGKPLKYRAVLDTEMGPIEISLRPDLAANHVRSFVALAKAGYYDGLVFDRTIHQEVEGRADGKLEVIEAGCPLGTGEAGYGSIGYWLKPEFSGQVTHIEGTVGASHGPADDAGACKFYITLCNAPFMDGNYTVFGQVTQGLNVARKILSLPVRNDPTSPEADRPAKPVVIHKVTIVTEE